LVVRQLFLGPLIVSARAVDDRLTSNSGDAIFEQVNEA
jgi:hypothetical protein